MGWADDMYDAGFTSEHGGLMESSDDRNYYHDVDEDSLSTYYLCRIEDCSVTTSSGAHDIIPNTVRIKLKLEKVGWVEMPSLIESLEDPLTNQAEYWQWFEKITLALDQDATLTKIVGNLIFCTIDSIDENYYFDRIYSVDLASDSQQVLDSIKTNSTGCHALHLPIMSFLEGETFFNKSRIICDEMCFHTLRVIKCPENSDWFITQSKNNRTIFFKKLSNPLIDVVNEESGLLIKALFFEKAYRRARQILEPTFSTENYGPSITYESRYLGYEDKYFVEKINRECLWIDCITDTDSKMPWQTMSNDRLRVLRLLHVYEDLFDHSITLSETDHIWLNELKSWAEKQNLSEFDSNYADHGNKLIWFFGLPRSDLRLAGLKNLRLYDKGIDEISDHIARLRHLKVFCLQLSLIPLIPESICRLSQLEILAILDGELAALPNQINKLQNLKTVYVTKTKLTNLPDQIGDLTNLRRLMIENNDIKELPQAVGKLSELSVLYVEGNPLTKLPATLGQLRKLVDLRIDERLLRSLPDEFYSNKDLMVTYITEDESVVKIAACDIERPCTSKLIADKPPNIESSTLTKRLQSLLLSLELMDVNLIESNIRSLSSSHDDSFVQKLISDLHDHNYGLAKERIMSYLSVNQ